ncbi:MAG TPA: hypothetical protein PK974_01960 [Rhodocyclaceae bacterium]|nr:hypothetical protein [Rhodocyclaceae bacterium]
MAGGIQELQFIESVSERDIDLLLLEELEVSEEFRDWLSSRVFGRPVYGTHVGAWHSVTDPALGESDLIFVFTDERGTTTGILIENKISAEAQPNQGDRYRQRGEKGKDAGNWTDYRTCLIAPHQYLQTQTEDYDYKLPYEEVMSFFISRRSIDRRHAYRAQMVLEGVGQHRRGYVAKVDNAMTDFVRQYWDAARSQYPDLNMPEPKPRPAGSTWINFFPAALPKSVDLVHQLTGGFVKLFFKGQAPKVTEIEERYKDIADALPGLEVQLAGKSVAISVPVEPLAPLAQPFADCREPAIAAMDIAQRLTRAVVERGLPA